MDAVRCIAADSEDLCSIESDRVGDVRGETEMALHIVIHVTEYIIVERSTA